MLETVRYIAVAKVKNKESYVVFKGESTWEACCKDKIMHHAKMFKVKYAAERAIKKINRDGFNGEVWEIKCSYSPKQ